MSLVVEEKPNTVGGLEARARPGEDDVKRTRVVDLLLALSRVPTQETVQMHQHVDLLGDETRPSVLQLTQWNNVFTPLHRLETVVLIQGSLQRDARGSA